MDATFLRYLSALQLHGCLFNPFQALSHCGLLGSVILIAALGGELLTLPACPRSSQDAHLI